MFIQIYLFFFWYFFACNYTLLKPHHFNAWFLYLFLSVIWSWLAFIILINIEIVYLNYQTTIYQTLQPVYTALHAYIHLYYRYFVSPQYSWHNIGKLCYLYRPYNKELSKTSGLTRHGTFWLFTTVLSVWSLIK
jgi:hypothetical protein